MLLIYIIESSIVYNVLTKYKTLLKFQNKDTLSLSVLEKVEDEITYY